MGKKGKPTAAPEQEFAVNEKIRAPRVLVIDDEKNKIGVMMTRDAITLAHEKGLDLVEVAPGGDPPVARIMDYGRFIYGQQKKNREAKKKQSQQQMKEIKLRTKTERHDLETKLKKAREFLEKGDRVKVHVVYRGREMVHPEIGRKMLQTVLQELEDLGLPMDNGEMQGRNLICVVAPLTKEQQAKKVKQDKQKEMAEEAGPENTNETE